MYVQYTIIQNYSRGPPRHRGGGRGKGGPSPRYFFVSHRFFKSKNKKEKKIKGEKGKRKKEKRWRNKQQKMYSTILNIIVFYCVIVLCIYVKNYLIIFFQSLLIITKSFEYLKLSMSISIPFLNIL